ncbi:restriction endonuclease [Streptomyces carminius]|uniref:Restriction endonuclease n=1 Tax=Streptomyces carminius TaxID=2665496 RepID=A0A2M8LXR1_9ACTN|nr:Uma2 family endonuclease [Streptomyces carminius]PJE96719.1 restriction endonuclease [Streptomyces carminius]
MSALTVDPGPGHAWDWDDLVRLWEETDWPEGCKVEIIDGIITVSPPPASEHNIIAARLQRVLDRSIPEDWYVYQTQGVSVPSRGGIYIPDLVVMSEAVLETAPGSSVPAGEAELVVEITSPSNARHDRLSKPAGYARAGVPLYLLVDRWAPGGPTVTLYGEPKGDVYRVLHSGKFGDKVHLPAPFDFAVDTGIFPAG